MAANDSSIDMSVIKAEALKEIQDEAARKAKEAIKAKLRQLASAQQVVKNIEREIADLEASIEEGSFTGNGGGCVSSSAVR